MSISEPRRQKVYRPREPVGKGRGLAKGTLVGGGGFGRLDHFGQCAGADSLRRCGGGLWPRGRHGSAGQRGAAYPAGVTLIGIDSVMAPTAKRARAWATLAAHLDLGHLSRIARVEPLSDLPQLAADIRRRADLGPGGDRRDCLTAAQDRAHAPRSCRLTCPRQSAARADRIAPCRQRSRLTCVATGCPAVFHSEAAAQAARVQPHFCASLAASKDRQPEAQ